MSLEQKDFEVEKAAARGGCLDTFIQMVTLGNFGVETYIKQTSITPTNISNLGDQNSAAWTAIRTGKTVCITNFAPQIGRRFIRNR
jgi:hypothetical protein